MNAASFSDQSHGRSMTSFLGDSDALSALTCPIPSQPFNWLTDTPKDALTPNGMASLLVPDSFEDSLSEKYGHLSLPGLGNFDNSFGASPRPWTM